MTEVAKGLETGKTPVSRYWANDVPVLQGRVLTKGSPVPVFGDDVWDLSGGVHRRNARVGASKCDFSWISDPIRRLTVKEVAMQRLNRPVPPAKRRATVRINNPGTVRRFVEACRSYFAFMDSIGVHSLKETSQDHLDNYLRYLLATTTKTDVLGKLRVAVLLYEARDWISHDRLTVAPWGTTPLKKLVGYKRNPENRTPRIPENIMGPLLRWSLTYVESFAPDIIAARRRKLHIDGCHESSNVPERMPAKQRLAVYLDKLRLEGRGLPGHKSGQPHARVIASLSGCKRMDSLHACVSIIAEAAEELGVEDGDLDSRIAILDGAGIAWRETFAFGDDVTSESRRLITACYIVCTYLSGMRDSETQDMRRGAYRPLRDVDGTVIRHKIRSISYKGERPTGLARDWVVIEPVVKAVAVLEELTAASASKVHSSDLLFVILSKNRSSNPALKQSISGHIAAFIQHINAVLQPRLVALGIPPVILGAGGVEHIHSLMFRRTVAWYIANQPFGIVAGMIQYGHMSETMFEGYAGTSDSGFRAEVDSERLTARRADILEMYQDAGRGVQLAGPMAKELADEFSHIRDELGDFPGKVVDERRREKMLEHLRIRLYPGLLADCFFEAKDAKCLRHVKVEERHEPVSGICDPHCPNACWAKKHLATWEDSLADVKRLAKRNRISPIQRDILRNKVVEYQGVIANIKEASRTELATSSATAAPN